MKNNALSLTALVFTAQAWLFSLLTLVLSGPILRLEAVDLRDVVWGCVALAAAGALLGFLSLQRPAGKVSAAGSAVLLALLLGFGL